MQSRRYSVTVQGRLSARFDSAFPGVTVEPRRGQTCLVTEPFDQGQLHGLLNRVRDFGFDLISVETIPADHNQGNGIDGLSAASAEERAPSAECTPVQR